jgi:hypothetical protein
MSKLESLRPDFLRGVLGSSSIYLEKKPPFRLNLGVSVGKKGFVEAMKRLSFSLNFGSTISTRRFAGFLDFLTGYSTIS